MFRFEKTICVDGRLYSAGDLVRREDVPAGYFESCLRLGYLVEQIEQPKPHPRVGYLAPAPAAKQTQDNAAEPVAVEPKKSGKK